jgi:hypothetical protein
MGSPESPIMQIRFQAGIPIQIRTGLFFVLSEINTNNKSMTDQPTDWAGSFITIHP